MKSQNLRLDDIARQIVHFAPEVYFELLSPVNPPAHIAWNVWLPSDGDVWSGAYARTNVRRLDTQLAPSRWLPDVGYVCVTIDLHELWASELQSAARLSPLPRASTCIAHLIRQAFPTLLQGDLVIRATELRMRKAPRRVNTSAEGVLWLRAASAGGATTLSREPGRHGALRFEPSRALFELDPDDPQFAHPRCWPLVCLSPNVSANQILQRHERLVFLQREHRVAFPGVSLLLGSVGRARFPNDRRFDLLEEYAVNEAAAQSALPWGHLTEQERSQLWIDAEERQRRLHEERIKAAEEKGRAEGERKGRAEGERKGRAEGERKGLLNAASVLLARTLPPEKLEAEMARLAKLKSINAIQQALSKLLSP